MENRINDLVGKTIICIDVKGDEVTFVCDDGTQYLMFHDQRCCENVYLDDICGEWTDLLNSPILDADEVSGDLFELPHKEDDYNNSSTWTFYKIATIKGSVTLRWYGSSNGYYSESVDFIKLETNNQPSF